MDIKIAICDDINEMCVCIENKVDGILKNKSIGYEIDIFNHEKNYAVSLMK